jgi:hypothetical protein
MILIENNWFVKKTKSCGSAESDDNGKLYKGNKTG